jgi:NADPH-dependent glutamate synthase beta subunit-like oxidoreductase
MARQRHPVRAHAQPPEEENKPLTWPYWPYKLRTSSSHEEGCEREFAICHQGVHRREGQGHGPEDRARRVEGRQDGRGAGSEQVLKADLVLLAMGFVSPVATILDGFGVDKDARGNAKATPTSSAATHQRAQGVRRRRHAARPVAGRMGDPRGPAGGARGRRVPDGYSDLPDDERIALRASL